MAVGSSSTLDLHRLAPSEEVVLDGEHLRNRLENAGEERIVAALAAHDLTREPTSARPMRGWLFAAGVGLLAGAAVALVV